MFNTIIFDLDGTLCDITHRLHFIKREKPDWDSFHAACVHDAPKPEIITIFKSLQQREFDVLIVSGRNESVRLQTENWLLDNNLWPTRLIMRPEKDYTPDHILKKRWLHNGTLPKENIICVFDDRQRVVDMWREEGLTCLQVAAWEEVKEAQSE